MSILIPGQGPLRHRACTEQHRLDLMEWFAAIEIDAWTVVNTFAADKRPSKIFLVTEQILTPEYDITYKEDLSSECEIYLEADSGIPLAADAHAQFGYKAQKGISHYGI